MQDLSIPNHMNWMHSVWTATFDPLKPEIIYRSSTWIFEPAFKAMIGTRDVTEADDEFPLPT